MPAARDDQQLYEDLAAECERRQDLNHRDIFLVLAGDFASTGGRTADAERLRQRLLEVSPHHLLRPFASFGDAMSSTDVREYVADLRQQFPPDWSENLLASWRREVQFGEHDLGPSSSVLDSLFGSEAAAAHDPWAGAGDVGFVLPAPTPEPAPIPEAKPQATSSPKPYVMHDKSVPPGGNGGKNRSSKKSRRGSPYDNPDYGPRVPKGPAHHDFLGSSIIYLLTVLVALAGLAALGYVLARPFLKM